MIDFFSDHTLMRRDSVTSNRVGATRLVHGTNNLPRLEVWLKNGTGAALTAGRPYLVRYASGAADNLNVIVPVVSAVSGFATASGAATPDLVVVAGSALATGAYGWFAYRGYRTVFVDGTTDVAAGDKLCLTVATSTVALIKRTDADMEGVLDVAVAQAAQAADSAVLTEVYLIGRPVRVR